MSTMNPTLEQILEDIKVGDRVHFTTVAGNEHTITVAAKHNHPSIAVPLISIRDADNFYDRKIIASIEILVPKASDFPLDELLVGTVGNVADVPFFRHTVSHWKPNALVIPLLTPQQPRFVDDWDIDWSTVRLAKVVEA